MNFTTGSQSGTCTATNTGIIVAGEGNTLLVNIQANVKIGSEGASTSEEKDGNTELESPGLPVEGSVQTISYHYQGEGQIIDMKKFTYLVDLYTHEDGWMCPLPFDKTLSFSPEDFYVELEVDIYDRTGKYLKREVAPFEELFDPLKGGTLPVPRVLLRGEAGFGKTCLCAKSAHDWSQGASTFKSKPWYRTLLIFYKLRYLAPHEHLETVIFSHIRSVHSDNPEPQELEKYIKSLGRNLLLILDGFDEMDEKGRKKVENFVSWKNNRSLFHGASFLVTSRPELKDDFKRLFDKHYNICKVSEERVERIAACFEKNLPLPSTSSASETIQHIQFPNTRRIESIVKERSESLKLKSLTPLMVSLLCWMVRQNDFIGTDEDILFSCMLLLSKRCNERKEFGFSDNQLKDALWLLGTLLKKFDIRSTIKVDEINRVLGERLARFYSTMSIIKPVESDGIWEPVHQSFFDTLMKNSEIREFYWSHDKDTIRNVFMGEPGRDCIYFNLHLFENGSNSFLIRKEADFLHTSCKSEFFRDSTFEVTIHLKIGDWCGEKFLEYVNSADYACNCSNCLDTKAMFSFHVDYFVNSRTSIVFAYHLEVGELLFKICKREDSVLARCVRMFGLEYIKVSTTLNNLGALEVIYDLIPKLGFKLTTEHETERKTFWKSYHSRKDDKWRVTEFVVNHGIIVEASLSTDVFAQRFYFSERRCSLERGQLTRLVDKYTQDDNWMRPLSWDPEFRFSPEDYCVQLHQLLFGTEGGRSKIAELQDLFNPLEEGSLPVARVLVVGETGSGKTCLCAKTAHDWAHSRTTFRVKPWETTLPIFYNLEKLRDDENLETQLFSYIQSMFPEDMDPKELGTFLKKLDRNLLLILDGYNKDKTNHRFVKVMLKQITLNSLFLRASFLVTASNVTDDLVPLFDKVYKISSVAEDKVEHIILNLEKNGSLQSSYATQQNEESIEERLSKTQCAKELVKKLCGNEIHPLMVFLSYWLFKQEDFWALQKAHQTLSEIPNAREFVSDLNNKDDLIKLYGNEMYQLMVSLNYLLCRQEDFFFKYGGPILICMMLLCKRCNAREGLNFSDKEIIDALWLLGLAHWLSYPNELDTEGIVRGLGDKMGNFIVKSFMQNPLDHKVCSHPLHKCFLGKLDGTTRVSVFQCSTDRREMNNLFSHVDVNHFSVVINVIFDTSVECRWQIYVERESTRATYDWNSNKVEIAKKPSPRMTSMSFSLITPHLSTLELTDLIRSVKNPCKCLTCTSILKTVTPEVESILPGEVFFRFSFTLEDDHEKTFRELLCTRPNSVFSKCISIYDFGISAADGFNVRRAYHQLMNFTVLHDQVDEIGSNDEESFFWNSINEVKTLNGTKVDTFFRDGSIELYLKGVKKTGSNILCKSEDIWWLNVTFLRE